MGQPGTLSAPTILLMSTKPMQPPLRYLARVSFLVAIASAFSGALQAQSTPADTTTTTPVTTTADASATPATTDLSVTTMAKYTVSDVPVGEQVLPTVRPVGDVM